MSTAQRKQIPGTLVGVLVLLGISVFINYVDRGNLSIAAPMLKDELKITPSQLGILLSAFFWTYACLQPVYGWLVDRVNVNWLLAAGFFVWSLATAATGLVHTFVALFVLRLTVGLGEAVAFPSYCKIIALNYSEEHRGLANSIVSAGLSLGPAFGVLLGGTLMARFGWRPFFIALGMGSLLWLLPWIKWMPPKSTASPVDSTGVPNLLEFLGLRSAWGSCIGLFCGNYMNYFLLTWLPYFLVRERHLSLEQMAKIAGIGYLLSALCCTVAGWLSDRWIRSGATPTLVRKTFAGGGLAVAGMLLGLCVVVPSSTSVFLLVSGMGFFGVSSSNVWAITQTLAGPQAAGRWTGFQNCVGNMAGVVAASITGFVLNRTGNFYWPFAIMSAVAFAGTLSWIFLVGRVEQVAWGKALRARFTSA